MKRVLAVLITAFGLIVWAQPTSAAVFTEAGDAGETFAAAAVLPGGIDRIQGALGTPAGDQADLYRFNWSGGDFYANTVNHIGPQEDLKLFLFNGNGIGIMMSDAGFSSGSPVYASAYLQMTGVDALAAGTYYLGIANGWTNAYDVDSFSIFPEFVTFNTQDPADPWHVLYGTALSFWAVDSSGSTFTWPLAYEINLGQYNDATGVYGPSNPTPEPGTMMLLCSGLAGLVGFRMRKMK